MTTYLFRIFTNESYLRITKGRLLDSSVWILLRVIIDTNSKSGTRLCKSQAHVVMATRTMESRLQQRKHTSAYYKRRRENDLLPEKSSPCITRITRKKQRIAHLDSASLLEIADEKYRFAAKEATQKRNSVNQHVVEAPLRPMSDEAAFFAEIDAPLTKVCGSCGERVAPSTTHALPYSGQDRRFEVLKVKAGSGRQASRGLIEAGIHMIDGVEQVTFCGRCYRSLSRRQVPPFSMASGYFLSSVPECLTRLNPMEARMIGIGICFTTCYTLGPLGQSATRGNSINFWNDACDVVLKLPRPTHRCGVVSLKKPNASGKQTYYTVRPWYLREALSWLQANNAIYKDIVVNEELLVDMPTDPDIPTVELDEADCTEDPSANVEESTIVEHDQNEPFTETFALDHETTCQREDDKILDVLQNRDAEQAFVLPAHDQPMNEYETKLLMQSCFPVLFPDGLGGFHPIDGIEKRVHDYKLAEYCAHLMAWHDRRFITHPTFKFFCLNLIQRRQIDGLLKRVRISGEHDISNDCDVPQQIGTVENMSTKARQRTKQYLQDLKPFFRSVRGSSLYWANVRDDLMSMVGNPAMENRWPTFFVTLSAADTVWPDFFCACDPTLTLDSAARLSASAKRRLLNANPDIAAHHFHRRFNAFFRHILCGQSRPLGEIVDFFWRIEFQHRGSPHVHALLWIKDAPNILELSETAAGIETLRKFADTFVSCFKHHGGQVPRSDHDLDPLCERPPSSTDLREHQYDLNRVVERVQQHVCSWRSSCQRNGKCRFHFPKPVVQDTKVSREVNGSAVKITFELARDNDATNNYNPRLLAIWRANMDIQIIGNAYGAAEYVAAYVSKAEPDSVRFYRSIEKALEKLPPGLPRERMLKRTANALLAIREVSAQEAVCILSSTLCLYGKSRGILRVKVSRHHKRFYRVPRDDFGEVMATPAIADEIRIEPIEEAYMCRPKILLFEQLSYREFCESYEVSSEAPNCRQVLERWGRSDGKGYIKARTLKQLIRPSPRYRIDESSADYCYAQLLLHKPWRGLHEIPVDDDAVLAAYDDWKKTASPWTQQINEQAQRARAIEAAESFDCPVVVLPAPQWSIGLEETNVPVPDTENTTSPQPRFDFKHTYTEDDVVRAKAFAKDVLRSYKNSQKSNANAAPRLPYVYPTDDQSPSMTSDQWVPFSIVMKQNRLRAMHNQHPFEVDQMLMIVSGEGGTGKSWLIRQIIADVRVVFGEDSGVARMLLMAHQGSAAYIIGGRTISSSLGFSLDTRFQDQYQPLKSTNGGQSTLRRLQSEYESIHLIIIDEYGVVSCGMMHWIDQRLREIFPNCQSRQFGGRDVIFFGDPGQLGPVRSSYLSTPESLLRGESEKTGRRIWKSIPIYCELQQQNRGCADPEWYAMLTRVRKGTPTPTDVELINSRVLEPPRARKDLTYLAYRNVDVDEANQRALTLSGSQVYHIIAHHEAQPSASHSDKAMSDEMVRSLLEEAKSIQTNSAKTLPLRLSLCIGAPVILTFNLQQRLGLCNGSRGTVYDIMPDPHGCQPIILVKMDDYSGPSFFENVSAIVPITSRTVSLVSGRKNPYRLSRTGIPLKLGYATTIHKIQGQTCAGVVLNPTRLKKTALAYVALSRVRTRQDLFIKTPITISQLCKTADDRAIDDAERIRVVALGAASKVLHAESVTEMMREAQAHNRRVMALEQL